MVLKTVSFNCHGLNTSVNDIQVICEEYNVFLQEMWLFKNELQNLHSIYPEFDGAKMSA